HRSAAHRFFGRLRESGHWTEYVRFSANWAGREDTGATALERAALLEETATVCIRHLHDLDRSAELLSIARQIDPEYAPARDLLERVLLIANDRERLRNLYLDELQNTRR